MPGGGINARVSRGSSLASFRRRFTSGVAEAARRRNIASSNRGGGKGARSAALPTRVHTGAVTTRGPIYTFRGRVHCCPATIYCLLLRRIVVVGSNGVGLTLNGLFHNAGIALLLPRQTTRRRGGSMHPRCRVAMQSRGCDPPLFGTRFLRSIRLLCRLSRRL